MDQKTVVVIEDREADRVLIARLLDKLGYLYKIFSNGIQALAWLSEQDKLPYLTLCDLKMNAGISGFQFARIFRRMKDADFVALVALTSYATAHVISQAEKAGFTGTIRKPDNVEDLAQAIRMFVRPELTE